MHYRSIQSSRANRHWERDSCIAGPSFDPLNTDQGTTEQVVIPAKAGIHIDLLRESHWLMGLPLSPT